MKVKELSNVCAKLVNFDIVDNKLHNISFVGGCSGNLKAVSILLEGMDVQTAINKLEGITCGSKSTSCTDQFSKVLIAELSKTEIA